MLAKQQGLATRNGIRVSWQARLLTRMMPRLAPMGVADGVAVLDDVPALRARVERLAQPGRIATDAMGSPVTRHADAAIAGEWTQLAGEERLTSDAEMPSPTPSSTPSPTSSSTSSSTSSPTSAAILYLHGGAFALGSPATHRAVTTALVRHTGMPVLTPDYRRVPEHPFPCALNDTLRAYLALLGRGIAPWSIVLAGDSAGGNLVLAALVALRDAGMDLPAAAVLFSPWADLVRATERDNAGQSPSQAAMASAARMYLGDASAFEPLASPARAALHGLPPIQIQVSDSEAMYRDSRSLASQIRMAGGEAELAVWHAMPHAWPCFAPFLPEARAALRHASGFIRRCTGRPAVMTPARG